MVVQHNLRAMNSNRMLGLTANVQSKSTEKLSSGYKINRAADDAAGLSISEKMRKQIRGLSQASLNAADGISAVQTAEGALNEVQDMLQRMNELAVKASNGSMSENDRSYIQNEISQLETEINRVAETTKFNETYLLRGNEEGVVSTVNVNAHDAGLAGKLVEGTTEGTYTFTADGLQADGTFANGTKLTIAGKEYTIDSAVTADSASLTTVQNKIDEYTTVGDKVTVTPSGGTAATYTYTAATTYSEADIEAKVTAAVTARVDSIKIGEDTYTYKPVAVVAATADSEVDSAITTNTTAGDKIIINDGGVETTYTYAEAQHGVGGTGGTGTLADFIGVNGINVTPADGDEITYDGTTYHYDADTANSGTSAGWYAEGEDAANNAANVKDLSDVIAAGNTVTYNDDGVETTYTLVDEDKAAGYYDGQGNVLTTANAPSFENGDSFTIDTVAADAVTKEVASVANATAGYVKVSDGTALNVATAVTSTSAVEIIDADTPANEFTGKVGGEKTAAGFYNGSTLLDEEFADGTAVSITKNGETEADATFTVSDAGAGSINSTGALDMMKDELVKASSIGTDTAATAAVDATSGVITITQGTVDVKEGLSFNLHVGADADMTNKIRVDFNEMSAAGLGVKNLNVSDSTGIAATYAVDAIQDAIQKISTQRSALGAVQNRLEHTIANLDNVVENTTAAESQIRDTDMATEMVKYSNNNILAQAGQAMLAQANQANQGVLSLLG